MLSQTSPLGFHPQPMQAMPCYQNYSTNGNFFYPQHMPTEDPRFNTPKRKVNTNASEDGSNASTSDSEEESSRSLNYHRKSAHSRKKKNVVVIRNINYIAGKRHEASGNESESTHDSEFEENKDSNSSNVHKDEDIHSQEADAGNWQAFQSFLLRAEDKMTSSVKGQNNGELDPIILSERDSSGYREESNVDYDAIPSKAIRTKHTVSADEFLGSSAGRDSKGNMTAVELKEIQGGVGGSRKATSDAFIMHGREKQMRSESSSDPLVDFEHDGGVNSEKSFLHSVNDESFMLLLRPSAQDLHAAEGNLTIELESELPSVIPRNNDSNITYEPEDLTLMFRRARVNESVGYDPAMDYDIQVPLVVKHESKKLEDNISLKTNEGLMKNVKERKLKSPRGGSDKKRKDAMATKMSSLKSTSLSEAQKRAEKLRNYKADLQKLKKEQVCLF